LQKGSHVAYVYKFYPLATAPEDIEFSDNCSKQRTNSLLAEGCQYHLENLSDGIELTWFWISS
jgi:hypothetical protein